MQQQNAASSRGMEVGSSYPKAKRDAIMQEHPSAVIVRMNTAYNAVYGTLSGQTRMKAEKDFYACHDWLRKHSISFHQSPGGEWVLDTKRETE